MSLCYLLLPHNWSRWSEPYEADDYGDWYQNRECENCGLIEERIISDDSNEDW